MEQKAREALDGTSKEILETFQNEYIKKFVYDSHGGNVDYHNKTRRPTYEFLNAWQFTEIRKQVDTLVTEMWYNPGRLEFDMNTFKHGSLYSSPPDVRASLMEILDKAGYSSSLWLSVSRSTPYWQQFLEDAFSGGLLERILMKHFKDKGFVRI
jgi:hypothetical protein